MRNRTLERLLTFRGPPERVEAIQAEAFKLDQHTSLVKDMVIDAVNKALKTNKDATGTCTGSGKNTFVIWTLGARFEFTLTECESMRTPEEEEEG